MAKWVIDTIELKKRQYVIEAYTKEEAIGQLEDAEPLTQEVLSDTISDIHSINEYEYNKDWKPLDPDIGPDRLKDNLDWIDKASGREGNGK